MEKVETTVVNEKEPKVVEDQTGAKEMVTVYFGRNRRDVWKASLDRSKVCKMDDFDSVEVEKDQLHNNKMYMVTVYRGCDYSDCDIVNVSGHTSLYASVNKAKHSDMWKEAMAEYKKAPKNFHRTDISIASDDEGKPFTFGDAMQGMFSMKIIGVRVSE